MKNYHLDLVKVTESAAVAAAAWVGRGDKESADKVATEAMRERLNQMDICAEIAIGEGIKDGSFGLYQGERVGLMSNSKSVDIPEGVDPNDQETISKLPWTYLSKVYYSIAVDPIEGTTPTAKGGAEAMSVISMANSGSMYQTENFYMDKIAVGPEVVEYTDRIDFDKTPEQNVKMVAAALGKTIEHVTVCVLDRPRTQPLISELRKIGCRIKFISDCDVTACIAACVPNSGIDMYWSIGGAPEAVIAAAAMKCMRGKLICQEITNVDTLARADKVFWIEDLVKGPCMFSATGITDGKLLKGVRFTSNGPVTESITMRSESGTIRRMITQHGN